MVEPVVVDGVPCEWVAAPGVATDRAVLYFHGGAYTAGSLNTHRLHVANLSAACGGRVLNVDYRLAPEHPHPAAVDDALTAYRWLLASGLAPERMVLAGDSAGGGPRRGDAGGHPRRRGACARRRGADLAVGGPDDDGGGVPRPGPSSTRCVPRGAHAVRRGLPRRGRRQRPHRVARPRRPQRAAAAAHPRGRPRGAARRLGGAGRAGQGRGRGG